MGTRGDDEPDEPDRAVVDLLDPGFHDSPAPASQRYRPRAPGPLKISSAAVVPAAAALRTAASEVEAAADDVEGAGRTALDGAGQFVAELSDGAATLSLSWASALGHAALSTTTVAGAAVQAVTVAEQLDRQSAAALGGRP